MTDEEIRSFFIITPSNEKSYLELKERLGPDASAELIVTEILKETYGFPVSFMDEGMEEIVNISEEKSQAAYEKYACEIISGEYEDLYDFTQELSAAFGNFE